MDAAICDVTPRGVFLFVFDLCCLDILAFSATLSGVLLGYSRVIRRGGTVLKQLVRATSRVAEEASGWVGSTERRAFALVLVSKGLDDYWTKRVGDKLLCKNISAALADGRDLILLFASPRQSSFDKVQILTIDREIGRVDRSLSSGELLRDAWDRPLVLSDVSYVPKTGRDSSAVRLRDTAIGVAMLGMYPLRSLYHQRFLARQDTIEETLGYSRRFASIVEWFSPALDPEMRRTLNSALHALWLHDKWLARVVDLAEAEQALSHAWLRETLQDHDPENWEYYEPGPTTGDQEWFNEQGVRIARATLYVHRHGEEPGAVVLDSLSVFGSIFYEGDAQRLTTCFKTKTIRDLRTVPN